ncbi:hypothetical protein [Denitratisoma oestradiolicum]|nr:hypothetical protein [Denitratisoma oestradiolicum]
MIPLLRSSLGLSVVLLVSTFAQAQPPGKTPTPDCAQARDPARCEARQKARAACIQHLGENLRQCIQDHMPPPDCAKSRRRERCEALVKAQAACRDAAYTERPRCLRQQLLGQRRKSPGTGA